MNDIRRESLTLSPVDPSRLANLCGQLDENIRYIEKYLGCVIQNRGHFFQLSGSQHNIDHAGNVLRHLYKETEKNKPLSPDALHLYLQQAHKPNNGNNNDKASGTGSNGANNPNGNLGRRPKRGDRSLDIVIQTPKKKIYLHSQRQKEYTQSINVYDINFGVGPAGTGKTFLAVCCGVQFLQTQRVNRLVLVRPAVDAGEKLGYLPGDLIQKIDPYLKPLYDALYEILGVEQVTRLIERHHIEIAPLAYMRGRTLNDAFIILDEGQNTSIAQMKMFLTRIGFSSRVVVTGDLTQIDLPHGEQSGLSHAIRILKNIKDINIVQFDVSDVVRHTVVQTIIEAYRHDSHHRNPPSSE